MDLLCVYSVEKAEAEPLDDVDGGMDVGRRERVGTLYNGVDRPAPRPIGSNKLLALEQVAVA